MATKKVPLNFEQSLAELEQLVIAMEEGNLSLDDALKHFERGVALTQTCQKTLQQAEQKVEKLIEKNGQIMVTPFGEQDG